MVRPEIHFHNSDQLTASLFTFTRAVIQGWSETPMNETAEEFRSDFSAEKFVT